MPWERGTKAVATNSEGKVNKACEGQEASCLQASHSSISRYEDGCGQVDLEGDDRATNCDWQYVMDEVR